MKLPIHIVRQIAVEAGRDPRSVIAVFEGRALPMTQAAVFAAIKRLGLDLSPAQFSAAGSR